MDRDSALVKQISKRYGPVIDLEANPGVMIEIIRLIRSMYVAEPGTPGPGTIGGSVTNADLMKAILKLSRELRSGGGERAPRPGRPSGPRRGKSRRGSSR
jgi:hypothetical protein